MTPGERIKELRMAADISQPDLAQRIGTTKQNIWKYENNVITNIPLDKIEAMARVFSVNPSYITGWSDKPSLSSPSSIPFSEGRVLEDEPSVSFPIIGSIAAGYDHEPMYDYTGDTQSYPKSVLRGRPKEDFFVLRVSGRSMEPMFFDGDTVLVLRCEAVDQGTVSVVLYNGDEASLKKVRYAPNWLEMIPINPEFPVKRIEGADLEKCRIMGRAMSMSREL